MAKNYFKSYIWLLETLQSRGPLTLKEIKSLWLDSSVNDEGKNLATRTFANHIYAIADTAHLAMAAPIISSYCAASVLWSRIFLKEKLSAKHYLMIVLVVIGIAIMGFLDM